VTPLKDITEYTRTVFDKRLINADGGPPVPLPIPWANYDQQCSVGYIEDRELQGLLLFTHADGALELSFAYAAPGHNTVLAAMLRDAGRRLIAAYAPETRITVAALNEVSAAITEKIFSGISQHEIYRATLEFDRI
jgi:hypothetical protein